MNLRFLDRYQNFAIFLLRVSFGVLFIFHGLGKLMAGTEMWQNLGKNIIGEWGPDFIPTVLGLLAVLTEFVGGMLLLVGFFTRVACLLMLVTMLGAIKFHVSAGDPFSVYSHPIKAAVVFLVLFITGPGRYSLERMIWPNKTVEEPPQ